MAVGDLLVANYMYEMNGLALGHGTDFIVTKVEGLLGTPQINTLDVPRPEAWGTYPGVDTYDKRTIVFTVDILGLPDPAGLNTVQTDYDNLMAALTVPDQAFVYGQKVKPFQMAFKRPWASGGKRFVWARPGRVQATSDFDAVLGHMQVVFELKCNDPRVYNLTPTQYQNTVASGSTSNSINITNNGNSYAYPVISLQGPATNPFFTIFNNGFAVYNYRELGWSGTLGATDVLTVDFAARTVLLNGTDASQNLNMTRANFWGAPPGTSSFVVYRDAGNTGAAAVASMTLTDTWSG